jgi:hypothetical protein
MLLMMSGALAFTSCTKDEDEPEPIQKPVITLQDSTGYISSDATVEVSSDFKVLVYVAENPESGKNIDKLRVIRTFNNIPTTQEIPVNDNAAFIEILFTAVNVAGTENIQFTAIDNGGQSNSVSINITTEETAGPIDTYAMKILGSYDNLTHGSSFATIDGMVYKIADATLNQAKIDFLYWYGVSTSATLASPADAATPTVYPAVGGWTTRNDTKFTETTVTADEFDQITNDAPIIAAATGASDTKIGNLSVDDVIGVMAADGRYALIKITAIEVGQAGTITFDVKVQQP